MLPLLKALFSFTLIVVILMRVDVGSILRAICSLDMRVLWAIPLTVVMYVIRAIKWRWLLQSRDINVSVLKSLSLILIGVFYGTVTPGKVGELARAFHFRHKREAVLSTTIVDKMLDVFTLVLFCIVPAAVFFGRFALLATGAFALLVCIGMFAAPRLLRRIRIRGLAGFSDMVDLHKYPPETIVFAFLASVIYYIVTMVSAIIVVRSLGLEWLTGLLVPVVVLLGNVPLTISGIGLREYVSLHAFQMVGQDAVLGVSFSVVIFAFNTLLPGILGFFVSLFIRPEKDEV